MMDVNIGVSNGDFESQQEHLARESSLVCRENRRLRLRVEELEAEKAAQLDTCRAALTQRPSVDDVHNAMKRADGLQIERDALTAELESLRSHNEGVLEAERALHHRREVDWQDREWALEHALEESRTQLASEQAARALLSEQVKRASEGALAQGRREAQEQLELAREEARRQTEEAKRASAESVQKQLELHRRRVAELQAELAEAQRQVLAEAQPRDILAGQLRELKSALASARGEVSQARAHLAEERRARDSAETEAGVRAAALAKASKDAKAERARLQALVASAEESGRGCERSRQQEAMEVGKLGGELRRCQVELARARREVAAERERADAAAERISPLEMRISELEMRLHRSAEESAALRREIERLGALVPRPPSENKSSFGEFVHLRREVSALKQVKHPSPAGSSPTPRPTPTPTPCPTPSPREAQTPPTHLSVSPLE